MSVPIVIATFLALLIAGRMINRTESRRPEVVFVGKQYNWIEKKKNVIEINNYSKGNIPQAAWLSVK